MAFERAPAEDGRGILVAFRVEMGRHFEKIWEKRLSRGREESRDVADDNGVGYSVPARIFKLADRRHSFSGSDGLSEIRYGELEAVKERWMSSRCTSAASTRSQANSLAGSEDPASRGLPTSRADRSEQLSRRYKLPQIGSTMLQFSGGDNVRWRPRRRDMQRLV